MTNRKELMNGNHPPSMRLFNLTTLAKFFPHTHVSETSLATITMNAEMMYRLTGTPLFLDFYSLVLVTDGYAQICINGKQMKVEQHSLLRIPSYHSFHITDYSKEFMGSLILCDSAFYETQIKNDNNLNEVITLEMLNLFRLSPLDETKVAEIFGLFSQIEKTICQPHVYKKEMMTFLIHLLQMTISELFYENYHEPHDLQHKENIFKIFMHLATHNFRTHRQIHFYAERLNITTTYLSRIVREVSGNTVYSYLSDFLYKECCKLLKTTDMTLGEIAFSLNFNDQSAFTNFFKLRSGMTPKEYRKKKEAV